MLISARQAARVLAEAGVSRTQAGILLAAGLAGPRTRTAGAVLHDSHAVEALAAAPYVDTHDLGRHCPYGVHIARLDRATPVDAEIGWFGLAELLRHQPAMTPMTRALLAARLAWSGRLPWVATLCGYVVLGADATRVHGTNAGTTFTLSRPGPWSEHVTGRRWPTSPGGRPGLLWTPEPTTTSRR